VSEETGTNIPENCTAGKIVMMAAAKIAAVWVEAKTDISKPNPVVAKTYTTPPRSNVAALPFSGTRKRRIARATKVAN